MQERCTARHATVVVTKSNVGFTKECMSAAHVSVVPHLTILSKIPVRNVTAQHKMMTCACVWILSRISRVIVVMGFSWDCFEWCVGVSMC